MPGVEGAGAALEEVVKGWMAGGEVVGAETIGDNVNDVRYLSGDGGLDQCRLGGQG